MVINGRAVVVCFLIGACSGSAASTTTEPSGPRRDAAVLNADSGENDAAPELDATASDADLDAGPRDTGTVERPLLAAPKEVVNGFLRDPSGRSVILRGVNLTGMNKYPPYFDQKTQADYQRVRTDWGMNSIRLVMTWAAIEPNKGAYDDTYLDKLALRVEWARSANVLVVLDMHQDVYGEGFASGGGDGAPKWSCDDYHYSNFQPSTISWTANYLSSDVRACYDKFWASAEKQSHFAEAWRRVAKRLAAYDNVVGFDIMNEPFWGDSLPTNFEKDRLMPLYEDVTSVVRQEAPGWVAFVEPSSTRNYTGLNGLPKPTFANYVFSPHSYDPLSELGTAFDPSRRAKIIQNMAALWQEAKNLGGALWVGEYGGMATLPGIVHYMTAQYDGMGAVGASSAYWDYTGSYGLVSEDGGEQHPLVDTIIRPYPEAIAGTPVSWSFDPATYTFSLKYHADTTVTAPTVISTPARAFPSGFQILCNGCQATKAGDYVVVTKPPTGDPAVITVRP